MYLPSNLDPIVFRALHAENRELRGYLDATQAQLSAVLEQVRLLREQNDAMQTKLSVIESTVAQARIQQPETHEGQAAATPSGSQEHLPPSSPGPVRRGGGGAKSHMPLRRAFVAYVRAAMGVGPGQRLPHYQEPPPQNLLRIDWLQPLDSSGNSPVVARYLASPELQEDAATRTYLESLSPNVVASVCRESMMRLARTYKDQQKKSEEEQDAEKRKRRQSQRRSHKWATRRKTWREHEDIRSRYGDHDFLPLEAMSEDETADEDLLTELPNLDLAPRSKDWGIVRRIPWRSRELEEAIEAVDRRSLESQGRNARRTRTLARLPTVAVPANPAEVVPLPDLVYRWMVSKQYKDQYPSAITAVQRNKELTEANAGVSVVRIPSQWGQDPAFRLVVDEGHEASLSSMLYS